MKLIIEFQKEKQDGEKCWVQVLIIKLFNDSHRQSSPPNWANREAV